MIRKFLFFLLVVCESLDTTSGGEISFGTDGQTTTATYSCEAGYTISGTSPLTCRSDGTWDFTAATCGTNVDYPD